MRATCKPCDRAARADRRRPGGPRPGALVLVGKFPEPPAASGAPAEQAPVPRAGDVAAGTYTEAAEQFIAALVPPAGPADALLVTSLRDLASKADIYGVGLDAVKNATALVARLINVQRELAATRASKPVAKPAAAPKSKLARFGGASA